MQWYSPFLGACCSKDEVRVLPVLKQAVLQDALEPKMSKVSLLRCHASWVAPASLRCHT